MFEWSETALMVGKMVRSFAEKEIEPLNEKLDSGEVLPFDLMRKMAQTFGLSEGFMLAGNSKKKGSEEESGDDGESNPAEDPSITYMVMKELSRVNPGFCLSFAASLGLCGLSIMKAGTPEQKKLFGVPVMKMDKIGAWGMTEPDAGSDAFSLKTTAVVDGDGYILNGSKTFITNAPFADVFVVYARIVRDGQKGVINAFVFDRDTPGLSVSKPMKKMGMCSSPTGEIFLSDVKATKLNLLGGKEKSPKKRQAMEVFIGERTGLPAMALGIVERCLEDALKYAVQRKQFGQPIAEFQAVQLVIAEMFVAYENVRNMLFKSIAMQKSGSSNLTTACAMKLYCARAATKAALDAIQIMGGYGYMKEYHVELLMRDAKLLEIGGGTNEIQALMTARELVRRTNEGQLYFI